MNEFSRQRLIGFAHAFDHPVTLWITFGLATVLIAVPVLVLALDRSHRIDDKLRRELWQRYRTWLVLVPLMLLPLLAGALWTMLAVATMGIGCYLELVRHTTLKSQRAINAAAIVGIAVLTLGALDHWWELFTAA